MANERRSMLACSDGGSIGFGGTYYYSLCNAPLSVETSENGIAKTYFNEGCKVDYFRCLIGTNSVNGSSSVTVRKNGADTSLVVTFGASATGDFTDLTNSVTFADGDYGTQKIVTGGTSGYLNYTGCAARTTFSSGPSKTRTRVYMNGWGQYTNVAAGNNVTDTLSDARTKVVAAINIVDVEVYVDGNTRGGSTTFRTIKNGSTGGLSATVGASTTGRFSFSGTTDALAADNDVCLQDSASGAGGIYAYIFVDYQNADDVTNLSNEKNNGAITSGAYMSFLGGSVGSIVSFARAWYAPTGMLIYSIGANVTTAHTSGTALAQIYNATGNGGPSTNPQLSFPANTTGYSSTRSSNGCTLSLGGDVAAYVFQVGAGNLYLKISVGAAILSSVTDPAYARPASDITTNNWLTDTGGSTNLYAAIDESATNDADYVYSPNVYSGSPLVVGLTSSGLIDPNDYASNTIYIRIRKKAGGATAATIKLLQNTTEIASFVINNLTTSFLPYEFQLTPQQAANITDYNALRFSVEPYSGSL